MDIDRVYLTSSVRVFARRPVIGWIAIGIALFAVILVPTAIGAVPRLIAATLLTQVLAMALTAIGLRIGVILFAEWQPDLGLFIADVAPDRLHDWLQHQYQVFYKSWGAVAFAVAFALVTVTSYWWSCRTYVGQYPLTAYLGAGILMLTGFVCGIALANIFFFSRFVWRLGGFPLKIEAHGFGVMSTGRTMARIYLIAAGIWLCYTTSAVWLEARWVCASLAARLVSHIHA